MTTFIGDIHGDIEIVKKVFSKFKDRQKVFVGDILDSFVFNIDDQRKCLDLILENIQKGDTTLILGNHELSYLYGSEQCAGWNQVTQDIVDADYRVDLFKYAKTHLYLSQEKLLITHAGLTKPIWDIYYDEMKNDLDNKLSYLARDTHSILFNCGYKRSGNHEYGGIFWCHWYEEFIPIPGLKQVVGHTPMKEIEWKDGGNLVNWNIDCLQHKHEVLSYAENGKFIIEPF
jgi:hypothetical protein